MPDARKPLSELKAEWEQCTRCELGVRRKALKGNFVFGEGSPRGIMFIGEGPGWQEEAEGRPFIGESGDLLRGILQKLSFREYYISNLVTCRACEPVLDADGNPTFRQRRKGPPFQVFRDTPPMPTQWKICIERLYEEIYIVDPIVIVSLGVPASEALTGHSVTIGRDRGKEETITIPGAGFTPILTEKRKAWLRKVDGEWRTPTEPSRVSYTLIPTIHPAFVLRKIADQGHDSPFRKLVDDIRKAVKIYEFYMQEVHQQLPTATANEEFDHVNERDIE